MTFHFHDDSSFPPTRNRTWRTHHILCDKDSGQTESTAGVSRPRSVLAKTVPGDGAAAAVALCPRNCRSCPIQISRGYLARILFNRGIGSSSLPLPLTFTPPPAATYSSLPGPHVHVHPSMPIGSYGTQTTPRCLRLIGVDSSLTHLSLLHHCFNSWLQLPHTHAARLG